MSAQMRSLRTWLQRGCALVAFVAGPSVATTAELDVARQFFAEPTNIGAPEGRPLSATITALDGRVLGYAFSTWSVSGSLGYSGRPIDIVAAVTPDGILAGAQIVAHEEPILVIGIPREALAAYVANFKGVDIKSRSDVTVLPAGARTPRVVAGATVTSTVIRDALFRSARAVLRAHMMDHREIAKPRLDRETLRIRSWDELVADGSIKRKTVSRGEAARLLSSSDDEPEKPFIDLWLALASPPPIGESLVGKQAYNAMTSRYGAEDNYIFVAASGLYSFKGTEWRRSGVFDRFEIVQKEKTFRLNAGDHLRVDTLRAKEAPELREMGIFRLAADSGFDPTAPFRLDLYIAWQPREPNARANSAIVPFEYTIPDSYLVRPQPAHAARGASSSAEASGDSGQISVGPRPRDIVGDQVQAPLWQDIWWGRRFELLGLALMLVILSGLLIFQDAFVTRIRLYHRTRTVFLIATFVFLGLVANAQLSVVNVVTFVHALLSGFRWELFLLDPLIFVLWSFVAVSMLFWGRGVFCGWLCPFGALQELLNEVARRLGIKQITVPFGLHERLWMIKYVIFLAILAVSLNSIMAAFALSEIEPFKTAITLKFIRDLPLVAYAIGLLAVGLFIERFFCRYLCPLGAALAIPARMRTFEWLKRRKECGTECQICAKKCTVQAIHPLGQINSNECIYCLQCQANCFDPALCPPLVRQNERRKLRDANAVRAPLAQGAGHVS